MFLLEDSYASLSLIKVGIILQLKSKKRTDSGDAKYICERLLTFRVKRK